MPEFIKFTSEQELEVRLWVRQNFENMIKNSNVWHPTVIDEVRKIIKEEEAKTAK